jgi:hypothetical protein
VGVASALIKTTPLVAMLIPASKQLQQTNHVPARRLLLPRAHATTLAGSVTLIGTTEHDHDQEQVASGDPLDRAGQQVGQSAVDHDGRQPYRAGQNEQNVPIQRSRRRTWGQAPRQ